MPSVLRQVQRLAALVEASRVESFTPSAATPAAGYDAVPIDVERDRALRLGAEFLRRLRDAGGRERRRIHATGRLFDVQTVDLTPAGAEALRPDRVDQARGVRLHRRAAAGHRHDHHDHRRRDRNGVLMTTITSTWGRGPASVRPAPAADPPRRPGRRPRRSCSCGSCRSSSAAPARRARRPRPSRRVRERSGGRSTASAAVPACRRARAVAQTERGCRKRTERWIKRQPARDPFVPLAGNEPAPARPPPRPVATRHRLPRRACPGGAPARRRSPPGASRPRRRDATPCDAGAPTAPVAAVPGAEGQARRSPSSTRTATSRSSASASTSGSATSGSGSTSVEPKHDRSSSLVDGGFTGGRHTITLDRGQAGHAGEHRDRSRVHAALRGGRPPGSPRPRSRSPRRREAPGAPRRPLQTKRRTMNEMSTIHDRRARGS